MYTKRLTDQNGLGRAKTWASVSPCPVVVPADRGRVAPAPRTMDQIFTEVFGRQFQLSSVDPRQGLTLVHLSAQPEPFLTQNTPCTPPNTHSNPLNTPWTATACTPYPKNLRLR